MAKRHRSDALAAVHETVAGLRDADVIDARSMKFFDSLCLATVETPSSPRLPPATGRG